MPSDESQIDTTYGMDRGMYILSGLFIHVSALFNLIPLTTAGYPFLVGSRLQLPRAQITPLFKRSWRLIHTALQLGRPTQYLRPFYLY